LMLTHLKTPHYYVTHTKREDVDTTLESEGKVFVTHDLQDWASQLRAMIGHDIYRAFDNDPQKAAGAVHAKLLIVVSESDHMVNPGPAQEFAALVKPNARVVVVSDEGGHQASGEHFQADVVAFLDAAP